MGRRKRSELGEATGGAGAVGRVFVRSTRRVAGRRWRGVGAEGRNGQGELQDAQQEPGEVQGESGDEHWVPGSSCGAYSDSVHWLGTGGK